MVPVKKYDQGSKLDLYKASAEGLTWKITALKLLFFNISKRLIGCCFCCSVDRLFLLGQLILATVATHATLNSCGTLGKFALNTGHSPGFFSATFCRTG